MRLIVAVSIVMSCLLATPLAAQTIEGRATVIDGDTIEIVGQRIRLFGIDAPESSQLCRGEDSQHYRCGRKQPTISTSSSPGKP